MKTSILSIGIVITASLIFSACKKEFDTPPLKPVNEGAKIFISQIKPRVPAAGRNFKFSAGDSSLYCTVIADETSGNIYKQIFIRDEVGSAIQVNLVNSGGLYVGDRLRINMNNLYVINANNMIYLDSVDVEKSVVKLSSGNTVNPSVISLSAAVSQTNPLNAASLQSQLVQITGVEFVPNPTLSTLGDPISKSSVNQVLKDCSGGKTLIVRSSGYANFASKPLPTGNGVITAILTQYNGDMQLTIRNYAEINMNGTLCGGGTHTVPTTNSYLTKNFNDNSITSGGWTTQKVSGNADWTPFTFNSSGQEMAKITNLINSVKTDCETWLISPAIDISGSTNPVLVFQNAYKETGPPLELYVSTNYSTGLPSTATWTKLNFTLSGGNFAFVSSGNVSLSAYKNANTRIAFKYIASLSNQSTWEIDDVVVKEN